MAERIDVLGADVARESGTVVLALLGRAARPEPRGAQLPNHIIGSLLWKYFPGLAMLDDDHTPSRGLTWEHYQQTKDGHDVTVTTRVITSFFGEKATKGIVKSTQKILSVTKHTLRYKAVM
ncbi:Glutamate decarboxylase 1 [Hordeum vulgare]|nr:Glutamate decarboxylase 1 [Hordeum vulgare]